MAATATTRLSRTGDDLWKSSNKLNAEIFTMTYGALVVQLLKDFEDFSQVNIQLDKMLAVL